MIGKLKATLLLVPAIALAGCEIGTKIVEQEGPRGTAIAYVADKSSLPKVGDVPPPPYELTAEMRGGERARDAYENVPVLGDLSTEEFNYTMAAMTNWVSPADGTVKNGGCNYCHNPANMASDEIYTKVVARRMLQQTRAINGQWSAHFAASNNVGAGAGVTCWTCHRGKPVPAYAWSEAKPDGQQLTGRKFGQNTPAMAVAYASLPYDSFSSYLQGKNEIRVGGKSAYPAGDIARGLDGAPIQQTEKTYGLMMHMSQGLGVNCTYCHNSQNFANWSQSREQRVSAWYGIRMVRDINDNYITALGNVWPANRRGPAGDPLKVNCTTCHQNINKPLGGYPMLKDYPGLGGAYHPTGQVMTAAAPPLYDPRLPGAAPAAGVPATDPVAQVTTPAKPAA